MKNIYYIILLLVASYGFAQPNTEVYLFDLKLKDGTIELVNHRNISNNKGYDNQPSYYNDNIVLFSSTRNGQTDIAKYNIRDNNLDYLNDTPNGSEYSPLKIPGDKAVSAIRLDEDGKQLLYRYDFKNGMDKVLIKDLVVGYHLWYTPEIVIASILDEGGLSLVSYFFKENKNYKFQKKIGRSLHKIPNSKLISYISKENETQWEIKSVNPMSGATNFIINTIPETEDMCWLINGTILMPKGNTIYQFNPQKDKDWSVFKSFDDENLQNITRITTNEIGTMLCLVSDEVSKPKLLEPKLENLKWIVGNWKGEAFGGKTEENWSDPSGGSMMASFKLIVDEQVVFYELEIIRELEDSLILQLKHFNNDLKAWESKDETIDFPLIEITENKAIFEGMSFERISDYEMNVYVDIENENGKTETVKFNYKKSS